MRREPIIQGQMLVHMHMNRSYLVLTHSVENVHRLIEGSDNRLGVLHVVTRQNIFNRAQIKNATSINVEISNANCSCCIRKQLQQDN